MESETRAFNGLGSYNLNYEYNLAGQLKKVTNPWGAEVSYGYDKAGRLTGEALNIVGKEGWELVAVIPPTVISTPTRTFAQFCLKRPLAGQS